MLCTLKGIKFSKPSKRSSASMMTAGSAIRRTLMGDILVQHPNHGTPRIRKRCHCLSEPVHFLSSEGWLFSEKHIKQSRQFGLLLSSTRVAGSVLGKLCESVCHDALSCVLRKVDRVPRRGQRPTLVVVAAQRPSLPFRPLVHVHVASGERNEFIDLNVDPAPVSCDMHLLYFEMAEHNQRLSRLEEVTPAE